MVTRDELELMASRHLDGETTAAEEAALQAALADPAFAEWFDELKRAHEAMAEFAGAAPAGIADAVGESISGKVHAMPMQAWKVWVPAAAALLLAAALWFISGAVGNDSVEPGPPVAKTVYAQLDIEAFSSGQVRVVDAEKTVKDGTDFKARVSLPATVQAPADAHAVLRVGAGAAVLKPGAVARLADVDADGVPQLDPVEGDMYLESRTGALASRLGGHAVSVRQSGLLLRQGGLVAEPKFGTVRIGSHDVRNHEAMRAAGPNLEAATQAHVALEDWVIEGRLDLIRRELRVLLGESYDTLLPAFQSYWEPPLRGIMSRPADAATSAMLIRAFEEHLWLPEWGENERKALLNMADIIGEGTSESDIPQRVRDEMDKAKEFAKQNPELARSLVRGRLARVN